MKRPRAVDSDRVFRLPTMDRPQCYETCDSLCCNPNIHGDFFGRAFDIKNGGKLVTTGCTAFGLERWVYAFFAQHGTRPEAWPAAIREDLERGAERQD